MGGSVRVGFVLVLLALGAVPVLGAAPSPIADAAERSDHEAIFALIASHADVNAPQPDGMTALHWAAHRDDPATARLLIGAKANPNAANRFGVTPLSLACSAGDEAMVTLLLDAGADPNARLRGGETPLMTAARTGKPGPVRALLAHGAEIDAHDRRGQTALIWAAAEGHAEAVSLLLNAGAEFRTALPSGFTPLAFAVREGRTAVVRLLLKAGADVNEAMPIRKSGPKAPAKGTAPLILAVENGHFDLAVVLLDAGANPNDARSGFTPLHTLTWVRKPNRGDDEAGDPAPIGSGTLTSLGFAEALLAHGADVNARLERGASGRGVLGRRGATPLLLACSTADVPLLNVLLKHGADPRLPNAEGSTPLMAAAGLGCLAPGEEAGTEDEAIEVVSLMLRLGGDINAVDPRGETAMHGAAYKSFPRVVALLAASGAKPEVWNRPNKHGWTPLAIAEGHRPGNFKPSPETLAALHKALRDAGITPTGPAKPAGAVTP